jgi:hypothetical protein
MIPAPDPSPQPRREIPEKTAGFIAPRKPTSKGRRIRRIVRSGPEAGLKSREFTDFSDEND